MGHTFHIGLDPASRRDYFGIAVHVIEDDDPIPHLIHLNQYRNARYTTILDMLHEDDLKPFRVFTNMVVDATGNIAICEALQDRYGERRVIEHIFTAGDHGTKMHVIEDSIHYLNSGYNFPIPEDQSTHFAECVNILIGQLRREGFVLTPSGQVKADHPKGGKNDLLNAWQLSLKGCRLHQFRNMRVTKPTQMLDPIVAPGASLRVPRIGHGSTSIPRYAEGRI